MNYELWIMNFSIVSHHLYLGSPARFAAVGK